MFNYLTYNRSIIIIAIAFSTQIGLLIKTAAANPITSDIGQVEWANQSNQALDRENEAVSSISESDQSMSDVPKASNPAGIKPSCVLNHQADSQNQIRLKEAEGQLQDGNQKSEMITTSLLFPPTLCPLPPASLSKSLDSLPDESDRVEFSQFDATSETSYQLPIKTLPVTSLQKEGLTSDFESFPEMEMAQATDNDTTPFIEENEDIIEENEDIEATPESDQVTPDTSNQVNRLSINPPSALSGPTDPSNEILDIRQRSEERDALIPISPLGFIRQATDKGTDAIYDAIRLDLGLSLNHAFQWLTDSLPDQDRWGTATDMDFIARWDVLNAEKPSRGSILFQLEGRWEYGTTGPQNLGFVSLGSATGTANTFSAYDPTFLVRNLYWQQGSREAGWYYRIGKITPDAILGTSKYLNPTTTFLPNGGTGFFATPLPDSGLGIAGAVEINDRFAIIGVISDANGDRYNWGNIGKGQFFAAIEFAGKIAPRTEKAGYSKLTFTYNPGAKAINASTGESGLGVALKLEQELTSDGRLIGIARYATNTNDSAIYDQQAGLHFVLNEPRVFHWLKHDAVGLAFNWVRSTFADRNEYDIEAFYRFPVIHLVDMTLHFQQLFNPSFAPNINSASVFSIRFKTSF